MARLVRGARRVWGIPSETPCRLPYFLCRTRDLQYLALQSRSMNTGKFICQISAANTNYVALVSLSVISTPPLALLLCVRVIIDFAFRQRIVRAFSLPSVAVGRFVLHRVCKTKAISIAVEGFLGWIVGIATERLRPNSFLASQTLSLRA